MESIQTDHHGVGALIHREIIYGIDLVVNGDQPVNPLFLHDLGTLTEAICLSDCYTWLSRKDDQILDAPDGATYIGNVSGPVSEALFSAECVKAYTGKEIEDAAKKEGTEFDYGRYLLDDFYLPQPFTYFRIDEQLHDFLDLHTDTVLALRKDPFFKLLRVLRQRGNAYESFGLDESIGFLNDVVESHERKTQAAYYMADCFGLENVHLPLLGRPLQVQTDYKQAFDCIGDLIKSAEVEVDKIEGRFKFKKGYRLFPIPHFARVLLANCKTREDIPGQLIEMRDRYAPLRATIIQYNERVDNARSIREVQKVDHELQSAWSNLLTKEEKDLSSRATYRIWEVVKTGPKMLIEFLDTLRKKDELEYPIFRVRGLYDLWSDLKCMPPEWQTLSLVEEVFSQSIPEKDYLAFNNYCEALEPLISNRPLSVIRMNHYSNVRRQ